MQMHLSEEWEYPYLTLLSVACFLLSFFKHQNRPLQLLALVTGLIPFVLDFPDLANHGNLMLIIGSALLILMLTGKKPTDELSAFYLRPILPVIYLFAGFHKLNADFFNPEVSCANDFLLRFATPAAADTLKHYGLALMLPVTAVFWELSGSFFLHMRRTQFWFLAVSALLHGFLAFYHFADFGSLMLALFYLWIPSNLLRPFTGAKTKGAFILCFLVACLLPAEPLQFLNTGATFFLVGLFLIAGFAVFYWHSCDMKDLHALSTGVRIWESPRQLFLPLLITAFTLSPYFGLRTSGNLTMFSNLKTEGTSSNHLLLTSNQLKIFALQEDQIKFVQIDPVFGKERRLWLKDYALPAVELYKKAKDWRTAGEKVSAVYWYQGELLATKDLALDERWQRDPNLGLHALWLDFRMIQPEGANRCRW